MAKKSKKTASKKVLIRTKKVNYVQLGVLILGLVMLGVLITRLFAASENAAIPQRINQLSLRYDEEVPMVAVKAADGTITYPSAAYTVDVATDGTLYCLPANSGVGTTRMLSKQEFSTLRRKILAQGVPEEARGQAQPLVVVNSVPTLTIANDAGDQLETAQATNLDQSPRFQAAAQTMKALCNSTGQPIARRKKPTFVPAVLGNASITPSPTPVSMNPLEYLRTAVIPSAHALTQNQAWADSQLFLINSTRNQNGLAPLASYTCLVNIANDWSFQMAASQVSGGASTMAHNPSLATPGTCNDYWERIAENVGVIGTGAGGSSEQVFAGFMGSPGHKKNILDPLFTHVGVGVWISDDNRAYVTQDFMQCRISSNRVSMCSAAYKKR